MRTWAELLLKYHKHINQSNLNINDDASPLFNNQGINRHLPLDGRLLVLEELEKTQHAAALDKKRNQWEIYWYTLDEWANLLYKWAGENALIGSVCTLYEITNGDDTIGQEFHGLDESVLLKALQQLEQNGKCELISFDDNQGVKFF